MIALLGLEVVPYCERGDRPRMGLLGTPFCFPLGDIFDSLSATSHAIQNSMQNSTEERDRKRVMKAEEAPDYPLTLVLPWAPR